MSLLADRDGWTPDKQRFFDRRGDERYDDDCIDLSEAERREMQRDAVEQEAEARERAQSHEMWEGRL